MNGFVRYTAEVRISRYVMIPNCVLKTDMSSTAKLLYGVMLSLATSSAKRDGYQDEYGVFIRLSVDQMCEKLNKRRSAINDALNVLVREGYIEKKRMGLNSSNKYYVNVPIDAVEKQPSEQSEKQPSE